MNDNIDPLPKQFQQFKDLPRHQPVMMLNLVRLRDQAVYTDQRSATGAQAYQCYGEQSGSIFREVGGEIIWRGKPECVLIGPSDEHWDIAFIAKYPTAGAFLAMVTNPDYQAMVYHRQAAVADSRLLRMGQAEDGDGFSG
ncbi:MAG: hypothetical protein ACI9FR_000711 [Cryomorphaceae bacterium]|jgi:uncharacterized protein (DUF1330 family)